jgi:ElaB/YqjD/DUF883 family membrane-anchored ribosome-binding protein
MTTQQTYGQQRDSDNEKSLSTLAGETASEAKSGLGEKLNSGADAGMNKAADGLGSAAEKMRTRAEEDEGVRATVEVKAAEAMDKTADFLKTHDSKELIADLEEFVKAHPLQAAAGALAAGYVIGKIVR